MAQGLERYTRFGRNRSKLENYEVVVAQYGQEDFLRGRAVLLKALNVSVMPTSKIMSIELSKLEKVSAQQQKFGRTIGIELSNCTLNVARAKIEDPIDRLFWGITDLSQPSDKQIKLAKKFGYDISSETRRVGSAIISDIMDQLNIEAIDAQKLSPGDVVTIRNYRNRLECRISSIRDDGIVFFKVAMANVPPREIA